MRREIQVQNDKKISLLKSKINENIKHLKSFKTEIRQSIDYKCVYEAGANIMSQAITSKSVSRNEIAELKEIEKQEAKNSKDGE